MSGADSEVPAVSPAHGSAGIKMDAATATSLRPMSLNAFAGKTRLSLLRLRVVRMEIPLLPQSYLPREAGPIFYGVPRSSTSPNRQGAFSGSGLTFRRE